MLSSETTLKVDEGGGPAIWWKQFCHDYEQLKQQNIVLLQRLCKGIELFRTEDYRRDSHLLRIWLAYLAAHLDVYGDEEEVRRLYKYLKNEHLGGDSIELLYLHFAQFELRTGKNEKCLALLEAAAKFSALAQNEALRKAIVEMKLLGTFRLDPLIEMTDSEMNEATATTIIHEDATFVRSTGLGQAHNNQATQSFHTTTNFMPPPTPLSQPTIMANSKPIIMTTPLNSGLEMSAIHTNANSNTSNNIRDSVPSSALRASEEQRAALSYRIRRLGLGPPKRAVVGAPLTTASPTIQNYDSPNDSTVPRNERAGLSPLPIVEVDNAHKVKSGMESPMLNSPSKTLMNMDKENMSLTTLSPRTDLTERATRPPSKATATGMATTGNNDTVAEEQITKLKAVRINGKTYKVLSMIGKGGSSRVYKVLATDNTIYALKKVNLKNLDESTITGYVNEINLLCSFKADEAAHIIKLIDHEVSKEHGWIYMLMEYGEADLSKLLRSKVKNKEWIDCNFIRYIWQQMLRAVQTVHAAKIVHCDLKPANFLLVGGTLKLIDFGISKAIMNDTTNIVRENQVGTVNYMSPEALQESNTNSNSSAGDRGGRIKIGRGSDVWSLGCILYELVYGKPPFAPFSLIQRLQKILDVNYEIEFPPLGPALDDPALLQVVKGCLIRQAKKRLTLEELFVHPFLVPRPTLLPSDSVIISKTQILELVEMFAKRMPNLDASALSERLFTQWRGGI